MPRSTAPKQKMLPLLALADAVRIQANNMWHFNEIIGHKGSGASMEFTVIWNSCAWEIADEKINNIMKNKVKEFSTCLDVYKTGI